MPAVALEEEITSINAIYDPSTLEVVTDDTSGTVTVLRLPGQAFSFTISFPNTYPDSPPNVDGTASVADHHKGEGKLAVSLLRDIVEKAWTPGQVCLFEVIEEAEAQFGEQLGTAQDGTSDHDGAAGEAIEEKFDGSENHVATRNDALLDPHGSLLPPGTPPPNWILSQPMSVSKSTFLAHCVGCNSKDVASGYITHLLSNNKKVASATHNISAWRLKEPDTGVIVQDCDDDGETAAGGRLLHLMQLMDVWNVMVVVTRWYGGVKLGPERFRCINGVAREVLVKAGYAKEEKTGKKGKK